MDPEPGGAGTPSGGPPDTSPPAPPDALVDAVAETLDRPAVTLEFDLRSLAGLVAGLLVTAAVYGLLRVASETVVRILIGVLVALAFDPLVRRVQRRLHRGRALAAVIVSAAVALFFMGIILFLGPPAVRQAARFSAELPQAVRDLYDVPFLGERLADADAAPRVARWVRELPAEIDSGTVSDFTNRLLGNALAAITVLAVAFAVMLDGEQLVARLRRLIPPAHRASADWTGRVLYRTLANYFAGSLIVASIAGLVILTAGLSLGVPLAPLAAIWVTLTNLIPQIGGFLGGSVFIVLGFSAGVDTGLACLVIFFVYMNLENHVIGPAIVGQAVNLSPPTTMIAALVGGAAAGVPGALVATPLVGTVKALYLQLRVGPETGAD